MEARDVWSAMGVAKNAPKAYWYATTAAIAHPSTRKFGLKMASYGARATMAASRGALAGVAGTTFKTGGKTSMRSLGIAAFGKGKHVVKGTNPWAVAATVGFVMTDMHMNRMRSDPHYAAAFSSDAAQIGLHL